MSSKPRSDQCGATLLEVLVAILILAFGLLGLGALQINALKNNQSSFQRTQAVMLTYFIIDSIRIDRVNVTNYTMAKTCTPPTSASGLANTTKKLWLEKIQDNLGPSACGEVTCASGVCSAKIYWNDERGTGGSSTQNIETKTRL